MPLLSAISLREERVLGVDDGDPAAEASLLGRLLRGDAQRHAYLGLA